MTMQTKKAAQTDKIKLNPLLKKAARHWGLQVNYLESSTGDVKFATEKGLRQVLSDLTERSAQSDKDLQDLINLKKRVIYSAGLEPCITKWADQNLRFNFYHETTSTDSLLNSVQIQIQAANESLVQNITNPDLFFKEVEIQISKSWIKNINLGDRQFQHYRIQIPVDLPIGYFNLKLVLPQKILQSYILSSPKKLMSAADLHHSWGVFEPLYAVRSKADWGIGSFAELRQTSSHLANHGATWIGTLPLLALNYQPVSNGTPAPECGDSNLDVSPYSALSRLFWNEIYLDVESIVSASQCADAKNYLLTDEFKQTKEDLRDYQFVDYKKVYDLKKKVLTLLSHDFYLNPENLNSSSYQEFLFENPLLDDYVKFRSGNSEEQNFHRFVQYQMDLQFKNFKKESQLEIYMDYPVGVNIKGFDFFKFGDLFFDKITVGAPPEPSYPLGQDWGFPCLHPTKIRQDHYSYLRQALHSHFKFSRILRIDHVMGLHRLFVKPLNFQGQDGVYLRYKPQELFAVACIEAEKNKADIIGENLGVVPEAVEQILKTRNINGMTVGQFLLDLPKEEMVDNLKVQNLTCLNTHDMPTFSAFLKGDDLDLMKRLGAISLEQKNTSYEKRTRYFKDYFSSLEFSPGTDSDDFPKLAKILSLLAESPSRYFVVNPEDLWQELQPQNIPGVHDQFANWSRKFKLEIEEWAQNPRFTALFDELTKLRKQSKSRSKN